ncbi:MAG TPA: efflux RND transporter periplasmic adaptor subunit [Candidatus Paceibacterota bacterium]|nr:efflux RND transporter periplasmic adaptor subunit [Candidatus Paceibacterota bacterium]
MSASAAAGRGISSNAEKSPPRTGLQAISARSIAAAGRLWLFAALVIVAFAGCKRSGGVVRYETAPVTRGNIIAHVTASGSLSAVVSVDVGCQVSGQISKLYVDYNSTVTNGQLLAQIDPRNYEAMVKQADAQLANSKANLELQQAEIARDSQMFTNKLISGSDYDTAVATLHEAEAAVAIQQGALDNAQANLGYCKITAPVSGIVISRKVDVGQTVNAAMSTPVLFTIVQDLSKMNITADVSEADIGQVKVGQPVDFTVDAFPDDVFHGTVTQVRRSPTTTQNVVTYETIISVDNPEQKLFPGMTADVSILVAQRTNVLQIPNAALRFTPPATAVFDGTPPVKLQPDERLVYSTSADGKKLKPVIVKAGITDGLNTEILDGLNKGGTVVTATLGTTAGSGFGPPPPR